MAISYKDTRRSEEKRVRLGPFVLALAALAALVALAPEITRPIEQGIGSMLALPRF